MTDAPKVDVPKDAPKTYKVVLLRGLDFANPEWSQAEHDHAAKAHMLITPDGYLKPDGKGGFLKVHRWIQRPAGHVHERHDAYLLCDHAEAIPAPDDEGCRKLCEAKGLTEAKIREMYAAKVVAESKHYDEQGNEIHPDEESDE